MDKNYFENEKFQYENIEIPEDLDFFIEKTLKEGRRRRNLRKVGKWSNGIAASFLAFVLLVNMFPKVAYAASFIPGLNKLIELVTFDKGFTNAVDNGLAKELNFVEEKDGVKLIVNGLAGDYKRLWIDYELIGNDDYDVDIRVVSSTTGEEIPVGIGFHYPEVGNVGKGYLEIAFGKFVEIFNLEIKVGKRKVYDEPIEIEDALISEEDEEKDFFKRNNIEYITTFNVPITLEKEIFGNVLKEVKLDNYILETGIGDIKIRKIESSKTRIVMAFDLENEKYEYMGFDNPRLVDNKGDEYTTAGFYFSSNDSGNNLIEFSGGIEENIKSLKFICDGIYYIDKNEKKINIDLVNRVVKENPYGIEFVSYEDKILTLTSRKIDGLSFEEILNKDEESLVLFKGQSYRTSEDGEGNELISYIKVKDESISNLELTISRVLKDKTKKFEVELIK